MSEAITETPFEKYETLLKKIDGGKFSEPFITLLGNIPSGSTISLQSITEYLKGVEPKSNKILETFVESVYPLSDKTQIHDLYKILIDHKIRVIRYYMLFEKVYPKLNSDLQQRFSDWKTSMQERIFSHDSDKFTDPIVVKSYVVAFYLKHITEELKKIKENEEDKKQCIEIINIIMKQLYFSHGKYQRHHSEHYDSDKDTNEVLQKDPYLLLEYFFDIYAVGDRFDENFGDYVERTKNGVLDSHFKGSFDSFIQLNEAFKRTYPELSKQKAKVKELKIKIKELQRNKAELESAKQMLEEKMGQASESMSDKQQTSEEESKQSSVVSPKEDVINMKREQQLEQIRYKFDILLSKKRKKYNEERKKLTNSFWTLSDGLSSNSEVLSEVRNLAQNLYLAAEYELTEGKKEETEGKKEECFETPVSEKTPHSKFIEEIAKIPGYLKYIPDSKNVEDLKRKLEDKVKSMKDEEQHLGEFAAILLAMGRKSEDLNTSDEFMKKIQYRLTYIRESDDESFFQARI